MIITKHLSWVHLPKTAGTTTDQLFMASKVPILWRDSQDSPNKHLPLRPHSQSSDYKSCYRQKVSNFRRLPCWLLSNHQHKLQRMGLDLPLKHMRNGFFWRERELQWLPADWWLERFEIDDNWEFIRAEYLKSDFLNCLRRYEQVDFISRIKIRAQRSRNCSDYPHNLDVWFSSSDLCSLYSANPKWSSIERKLYGNLLSDLL